MWTVEFELTEQHRAAFTALLDRANGNRRLRRLSSADIEATMREAVTSPLRYAWRSAGPSPDARALTAVCLAVLLDDEVVVAVSSSRGDGTPANAWHDITSWNVVTPSANAQLVRAWARRRDDARLRVPVFQLAATDTEASLRAQILASPDDDAPRRVLADLLADRGDPRGEFIAVQLELARAPTAALKEQSAALLREHGRAWAPIDPQDAAVTFARGFVEHVQVFASSVLEPLSSLCATEPVTQVRFVSRRRFEMESLTLAPWLARLRTLEFWAPDAYSVSSVSDSALETLLTSGSLGALSRLALRGQRIGDFGARTLAEHSGALARLRSLAIEDAGVGAPGARFLARIRWLLRLSALSLAGNPLQVSGLEALVGDGAGRSWRELDLSNTGVGNAGVFVLARAKRLEGLEVLRLARNRIGPTALTALLDAPQFHSLRELDVAGNPVRAASLARLAARFGHAPHRVED